MNLYKYLFLICLGMLFACEKEIQQPGGGKEPPINEEDERIKERIYYYFNEQSFWTEYIPDRNEEERKAFVKNYTSNTALLNALKGLTPFHSGYSGSIDRFSFLDESNAEGNTSSSYSDGIRMDTNDGYGLYYGWGRLSQTATVVYPVIFFVEGGSPADKEGVKRGAIVYAVNDDEDITVRYNGGMNQTDARRVEAKLESALEASTLKLKLQSVDGEETDYTLNYQTYDINPIVKDTIYKYERNIGYLAYTSFEEVDTRTSTGAKNRQDLEDVFTSFEETNISDLILDLRYNTGGYVEAAEYLAEKLIGSSGDGELMFSYDVNDYLASAPRYRNSFRDVYFSRKNNLELNHVYILVTQSTASAAELLISSLKPYLNVTLIAEGNRTYGKPVGFFPEEITDNVTLWVTSFKTINADGYTDFWDGIIADITGVDDYIFLDFGDPEEDMIAKALDLAGVSATTSSMRASSRMGTSAQRGVKLGIINKPRERNMLKTK